MQDDVQQNKLFVGGISWDTTDDQLNDQFSQAGTVTSATIIRDRHTNRSKGFGFVEMSTPEEAQKAIEMFDGQELDGRKINVSVARPKAPRDDRRGGDSGRGFDRKPRRQFENDNNSDAMIPDMPADDMSSDDTTMSSDDSTMSDDDVLNTDDVLADEADEKDSE
jgi:cold-inducible RNA-binding protein